MAEYPVQLQLAGRLCVVVGGGEVAKRKAIGLKAAGARVRMISTRQPSQKKGLEGVEIIVRPYRPDDLDGAFLAFAATDNREVNATVARDAGKAGVLVNVADAPEESDFFLPALFRRGDLTVSVSTAGKSPMLAKFLRQRLEEALAPEWGIALKIAAAVRQKRLTLRVGTEYNQKVWQHLLEDGLLALIAARDQTGIDRLLKSRFGKGVTLAELGVSLSKGKK